LQKKYYVGLPNIKATAKVLPPRVTSASLEGQDIRLGQYSTWYDASYWGRTRNIHVASSELDGTVLMPGETFSFNGATGERTWRKGYRMAHIFERKPGQRESEVVDGLAGGVCQVSTTLYNAVRKTNRRMGRHLKIVERNHHSLPVTYIAPGLDATVAWPSLDFKFRNAFPHPIYLRTAAGGSRLRVSVWGRVPYSLTGSTKPKMADNANPGQRNF
jgi:vancomycin resistance protein YoaR